MKNLLLLAVCMCAAIQFSGQSVDPDPSNSPNSQQASSVICTDSCPWDFNGDSFVSDDDLLQFLASFGLFTNQGCEIGDFDEDMVVDIQDLRTMVPRVGMGCQD